MFVCPVLFCFYMEWLCLINSNSYSDHYSNVVLLCTLQNNAPMWRTVTGRKCYFQSVTDSDYFIVTFLFQENSGKFIQICAIHSNMECMYPDDNNYFCKAQSSSKKFYVTLPPPLPQYIDLFLEER